MTTDLRDDDAENRLLIAINKRRESGVPQTPFLHLYRNTSIKGKVRFERYRKERAVACLQQEQLHLAPPLRSAGSTSLQPTHDPPRRQHNGPSCSLARTALPVEPASRLCLSSDRRVKPRVESTVTVAAAPTGIAITAVSRGCPEEVLTVSDSGRGEDNEGDGDECLVDEPDEQPFTGVLGTMAADEPPTWRGAWSLATLWFDKHKRCLCYKTVRPQGEMPEGAVQVGLVHGPRTERLLKSHIWSIYDELQHDLSRPPHIEQKTAGLKDDDAEYRLLIAINKRRESAAHHTSFLHLYRNTSIKGKTRLERYRKEQAAA